MNQNDNVGFYLYLSSYLCWCLFLLMASSYYLMCLRSAPRASFSISFKAGLLVVNFLSCCLSGNILISPFFLKDSLLGKEVLVERCFSFQLFISKNFLFIWLPQIFLARNTCLSNCGLCSCGMWA